MSAEAELRAKLCDVIVKQLRVSAEDVADDKSFIEDLGADSLDVMELVLLLEEEFDIAIADEDAEALKTVGNAFEYIKKRRLAA